MESREIPKGTMVHIGGIPFLLDKPALLSTHEKNWDIAFSSSKLPSEDNHKEHEGDGG